MIHLKDMNLLSHLDNAISPDNENITERVARQIAAMAEVARAEKEIEKTRQKDAELAEKAEAALKQEIAKLEFPLTSDGQVKGESSETDQTSSDSSVNVETGSSVNQENQKSKNQENQENQESQIAAKDKGAEM